MKTIALRTALASLLENWRSDLSPAWREVVDGVELGFDAMDQRLELHSGERILPSRRDVRLPGAPRGAHIFRAFDDIKPADVRCVLVGQDPYPSIAFSTGRAFESGEHRRWSDLDDMFSCSMRSLVQSLVAFRTGGAELATNIRGWPDALACIESAGAGFPTPDKLAAHWVKQGVLLLNASLTLSRFAVQGDPHQTAGHMPLWQPLIAHLTRHFAAARQPVVFLLLGEAARNAAMAGGIFGTAAVAAHPAVVAAPHPATGDTFLAQGLVQGNIFARCNQALLAQGGEPIDW